ncbi:MAG TPA: hypothetical protein VM869_27565 [Enhygromyxa sp.]|nr:hypothetical protein [Enhygromyxa sp.]
MHRLRPRHALALAPALALTLTLACESTLPSEDDGPPPLHQAELESGYPQLDGACRGPIVEPTHLVVTSTDFNTGAVGLVDIAARSVAPDLALASFDAVPIVADGRVFVLNRHGFDYVDELDPHAALALLHEFAITPASAENSANPQALVIDPEGRGWLSLFGAGELQQIRFPTLAAAQPSATLALDLREFADDDAIPELGALIGCGSILFVSAARIDRASWTPVDETFLIPVRADDEPRLFDFDPEHAGADAVAEQADRVGSWRVDPADDRAIVVLNSGLERIDLATGASEWLVPEELFADAGYDRLQLSSFDHDADGRIWVTAANADFDGFQLLRVDLDGLEPQLIVAVDGLQSVSGALEIVGHEAWFADTTIGASGLRVFDLAADPIAELPESPLAVGLPPMSLAPLSL